MNKGSLERAVEAAAKVNALLVAKGLVNPDSVTPKAKLLDTGIYSAELEINDLPEACARVLLLDETHNEVARLTNATVTVRGQLITPDQRKSGNLVPLKLCVDGPTQYSVDGALRKLNQIIASAATGKHVAKPVGFEHSKSSSSSSSERTVAPRLSGSYVQDKVYVGLDSAPAEFELRSRLIGPSRMYLKHIQTETNALVVLRGRGSCTIEPESGCEAYEPLHIYVAHPSVGGLAKAKELALNLIQTVITDYHSWLERRGPSGGAPSSAVADNSKQPQPGTSGGLGGDTEVNAYVNPASSDYLKRLNLHTVTVASDEKPKSWPEVDKATHATPAGFFPAYTPNYPAAPPRSSVSSNPPNDDYRAAYALYASLQPQQPTPGASSRPRNEPPVNTSAEMPSLVLYPIYAMAQSAAASATAVAQPDDSCVQPPLNPTCRARESKANQPGLLYQQSKVPLTREFITRPFKAAAASAPLSNVQLGGAQLPQTKPAETTDTVQRKPRRFVETKRTEVAASTHAAEASNSATESLKVKEDILQSDSNIPQVAAETFVKPVGFARPQAPVKRPAEDAALAAGKKALCVEADSKLELESPCLEKQTPPLSSALHILNAYADDSENDD